MQVGTAQVMWLLAAIAAIAAARVIVGRAVERRNRRRARAVFVLGFFCGVTATALMQRWGRGRVLPGVVMRRVVAPRRQAGVLGAADRVTGRMLTAFSDPRARSAGGGWRRRA